MESLITLSLFSKSYFMSLIEYWREIGLVIFPLATWFTSRKMSAIKLKTESANSLGSMQSVYDKYLEHNSKITQELVLRVNELESHNRALQENFNKIQISYAVVMGNSLKFEEKYNLLVKEHEQLRIDYEGLKIDFDKYKKANK